MSFNSIYRDKIIIPTILAGIMLVSCGDDDPDYIVFDSGIAVVTIAPDYSSANFEVISAGDHSVSANLMPGLHTDLAIRAFGGDVYILERYGKDNVIKLNSRGIAYQQSLGSGLNIQDIAVVSERKAYISGLDIAYLIVFDPQTGTQKNERIDLSQFNSFAGKDNEVRYPYVSALAVGGNYLYAACQRLDAFFGLGDTSLIAIVDMRDDEIAGSVKLSKKNPAAMAVLGDRMLVSSQGNWIAADAAEAGVEKIDLATNTNLGVIVDGSALGGNPSEIVFVSANKAYVVVGGDWTVPAWVVPFNPETGAVDPKIDGIGDASGGIASDGVKIYVGDRGFESAGVAVINPNTNAVEQKIKTTMPPSKLAVIFGD